MAAKVEEDLFQGLKPRIKPAGMSELPSSDPLKSSVLHVSGLS